MSFWACKEKEPPLSKHFSFSLAPGWISLADIAAVDRIAARLGENPDTHFWQHGHTRGENKEREFGSFCSLETWICPTAPQTCPCTLPDSYINIPKYIECTDRSHLLNVRYLKMQLAGDKRRKDINLFCCCFHQVRYWYLLCCFLSSLFGFKFTEWLHSPAQLLICFRKREVSLTQLARSLGEFHGLNFLLTFWVIFIVGDIPYCGPLKISIFNFWELERNTWPSGCRSCVLVYTIWWLDLRKTLFWNKTISNAAGPGPGPHPRYNGTAKSSQKYFE